MAEMVANHSGAVSGMTNKTAKFMTGALAMYPRFKKLPPNWEAQQSCT